MPDLDPVLGDPVLLARALTHEVKGNLLAARSRDVLEAFGRSALDDLLVRVPDPARRHLIDRPQAFSWYPIGEMIEIDRLLVLGPMQGDIGRMRAFGHEIASYDLPTIHKVLFYVGTPSFVLKRIGIAYGMYFRGGSAHAEAIDDSTMRVRFEDAAYPLYLCAHGISGWLAAAVELSGGKHVAVEHERCVHAGDAACGWNVGWQ